MRRWSAWFVGGLAVGTLSAAITIYLTRPPLLDEPILKAFSKLGAPVPYEQRVQTLVGISGRTLRIEGTYFVDHDRRSYDSAATTTLSIDAELLGTIFIANRVLGDDVYTLVRKSEGLGTFDTPPGWTRFRRGAIPENYIDIASDRPILDNLVLLRGEGAYLTLEKKHGSVELDGIPYLRYSFRLSPIALEVRGGTMGAIANRLGTSGSIDIWLDPAEETVRLISLAAPDYHSTTTVTSVGIIRELERP